MVTTRAPDVPLRAKSPIRQSRSSLHRALALAASNDSFASATDANARVSPAVRRQGRTTESVAGGWARVERVDRFRARPPRPRP